MTIPTLHQCCSLMDEYAMLDNIRAHSLMVARVSEVLFAALNKDTPAEAHHPAAELIISGALLHDIAKTPCLDQNCDHAKQGRDICLQHGFPEVAEIVREHVILFEFSPQRYARGDFLAKELVYYADKRVRHDEIVSLDERLSYILTRYGNNDPKRHRLIKENFDRCRQLETFLFSCTGELTTEVLQGRINVALSC